jgi:hypothetical protein
VKGREQNGFIQGAFEKGVLCCSNDATVKRKFMLSDEISFD